MQQQAMMQQQQAAMAQGQTTGGLPPGLGEAIKLKAREDAMQAVQGSMTG